MPDHIYILSEDDRDDIRRLLAAHRSTSIRHGSPETMLGTPEVYVARIQDGEIEALTEGTGEGEYDHPGFKSCEVYQIVYDSDNTRYDLIPISGADKLVFNISGTGISDSWFLVVADKRGNWIAVTGGASTAEDHEWGDLTADLEYGDTVGVTVNLDEGGTRSNVLPSKLLPSGYKWSSGDKVLVAKMASKYYALQGPCPTEIAGTGTGA